MRGPGARTQTYGAAIVSVVLYLLACASTTTADVPPKAPGVGTGRVLEVRGTYVALQGWIEPRGQETEYFYELGRTRSYGIAPELSIEQTVRGHGRVAVYEAIPELRPHTTYHFRLVAHSRGGTRYGKDKTFRTRRR